MLTPVLNGKDVQAVSRLAETIWTEHLTPIVGTEQVTYMLERSQSPEAIQRQLSNDNCHYFFISPYLDPVGYVALITKKESLFVSKLFIGWHYRSKGYGASTLREIEVIARGVHKSRITLRVNRNNDDAIKFFSNHGFKKVGEERTEIGQGFAMDDIFMARVLK